MAIGRSSQGYSRFRESAWGSSEHADLLTRAETDGTALAESDTVTQLVHEWLHAIVEAGRTER